MISFREILIALTVYIICSGGIVGALFLLATR